MEFIIFVCGLAPTKDGRKGGTYNSEGADGVASAMDDRREGTAVGTTVTGRYRTLHTNPTEREALGCSPL